MLVHTLALALSVAMAGPAKSNAMDPEEFRIYCGFLQEVAKDEYKGMAESKRLGKVAKLAKVNPKQLGKILTKGRAISDSCEGVAKIAEEGVKKALGEAPISSRLVSLTLDFDDPTHVVAYISWKADQEKRLEEEAAWVAWAVHSGAPIVRTLSTRAVDPKDGEMARFEGKISAEQMSKIEKERIDSFADARYLKLFDGVVFANPAAHPTAPR